MFGSINIVFLLVFLAIFIGRTIIEARRKRTPPPKIPIHFADDEEPNYFRGKAPVSNPQTKKTARWERVSSPSASVSNIALTAEGNTGLSAGSVAAGSRASPAKGNAETGSRTAPGQGSFALNLSRLSPMKQAVVMAEILGTPKGLL